MSIVVVYESMFGNTRQVATAIAEGLSAYGPVSVLNVNDTAARYAAESASLLLAGGPTHVHGMSRQASRDEARNWTNDPAKNLTLEPLAPGTGVREWINRLERVPPLFAAFDTRADIARLLSGAASGRIEHELKARGSHAVVAGASFLVSKDTVLEDGEIDRARDWAAGVGAAAGMPAAR